MKTRARRATVRLLAALLVALPLAACAAPPASTSPGTSAATSASASAAVAASAAVVSASPSVTPGRFDCPVASTTVVPPSNRLEGVTVSATAGYDEVAFTFAPSGTGSGAAPSMTVESAVPPFVRGASGLPLAVAGQSFIRLTFREMIVADQSGSPTLTSPTDVLAAGPAVREAVESEAFEGVVSWIVGSAGPGCARVTVDAAGARVLLDVRTP